MLEGLFDPKRWEITFSDMSSFLDGFSLTLTVVLLIYLLLMVVLLYVFYKIPAMQVYILIFYFKAISHSPFRSFSVKRDKNA